MRAGNNLAYLRRFFNLSRKEMAFILDKSEGNYGKIERGLIGMSLDNATRLSQFFEIKIDEFIDKEEYSLVMVINEKGKDYINNIFEKIKKIKGYPPPFKGPN